MTAGDTIVIRDSANSRQAVALDGTDDYVLADAHAVARESAADAVGAYAAWIYLDNITGTKTILSAGDNNSVNEGIHFDVVGDKLRIFLHNGAAATQFDVIETTGSMTAKEWIHVAVVQNGTRPTLYVNGLAVAMTDTTSTSLSDWYADVGVGGVDKFAIGVTETNATHLNDFAGLISDVKYWSVIMTADDILKDFRGETARATVTAALESHWDMDGDVTDAGLGADDGTLTGHAYNSGWSSAWSRGVELNSNGHAAERMNTVINGDIHTTVIVKGD